MLSTLELALGKELQALFLLSSLLDSWETLWLLLVTQLQVVSYFWEQSKIACLMKKPIEKEMDVDNTMLLSL